MDVNPGSAPSRHDRRERILGVLLLGAIRVCCRLFAVPSPEPHLFMSAPATRVPPASVGRIPPLAGLEDRGPPASLSLSVH